MNTDARWATCCHEAAHAAVAHALGVRVAAAVVIEGGRGFVVHGPCDLHDAALIAAAGDPGGQLAEHYLPPQPAPGATHAGQTAGAVLMQQLSAPSATALSLEHGDWEIIARYAAAVPDSEQWTPRATLVKWHAHVAVQRHRDQIVKLAEALYVNSAIARPILDEFLPDRPRRVPRTTKSSKKRRSKS